MPATKNEYFPLDIKTFDLFYGLAITMYNRPASVALCVARMTHAYLTGDAMNSNRIKTAFSAEGLDFHNIQAELAQNGVRLNGTFHDAASKLIDHLS